MRATWKHLGAPGAGVVSGVNAASAAGSDGWPGSPSKSVPLPGKMKTGVGWGGTEGTTPTSSQPLLFLKALEPSKRALEPTQRALSSLSSIAPGLPSMQPVGPWAFSPHNYKRH